jgi:uncharacterized membrane protein YqjE
MERAAETVRAREPYLGGILASEEEARLRGLTVRELVAELAHKGSQLARKEVELARAEVREDLRREIKMAGGLGVAGVCALLTLQMLLVAVAFGFMESETLPGWAISLIIAAVVLAIGTGAGLWGWARRVRTPLDATRASLRESVRWAKGQVS